MASIGPDLEEGRQDVQGIVRQIVQSPQPPDKPKTGPLRQSEDEDASIRNDFFDQSTSSPRKAPNSEEPQRSLYAAEVIDAEFVGVTVGLLGWWPKGVRITLNPIDSSSILPWAELYFPVNYREGSRLREAVERVLGRKMTSAEIHSHGWRSSIIGKLCYLSAILGVEHSEGRPLKFKHAAVYSALPTTN